MVVFISSEGYVKKSLNTVDRGKNAYIRTANTVRTYLHQQWETGEEVKIKNKNQEQL